MRTFALNVEQYNHSLLEKPLPIWSIGMECCK